MAPKRSNPKKRSRKPSKRKAPEDQFFKIVISLVLLATLVVLTAVAVRILMPLHPPAPRASAPPLRPSAVPEVAKPDPPTYEVFPREPLTPLPLKKLVPRPGSQLPWVAIIVDDMGYDRGIAQQLLALDAPLTLSLLPYGPFNADIMAAARDKGLEIMLHLPMEPNEFPSVNPGPGALLTDMTPDELIAQLIDDIDRLPGIVGVNNHMGSRISTSPDRMRQIFSILKRRELFYVDSRTTAETVAKPSAQLLQLPFVERDIFIDHFDDPEFIRSQLTRLIKRAKKQGYAVAIAHPHPATVAQLRKFLPRLKAEVSLVPASTLVQGVMAAKTEQIRTARTTP